MAKILVFLALSLVVALALGQAADQKAPVIKENQFLLNVWRGKQNCEGTPTLPISLANDATKCQVVLKVTRLPLTSSRACIGLTSCVGLHLG